MESRVLSCLLQSSTSLGPGMKGHAFLTYGNAQGAAKALKRLTLALAWGRRAELYLHTTLKCRLAKDRN
ncbi:hypothetical protein E2C01_056515 [Portunus trituberculatus]|uniref:Uncharacterized protein n=1 Tax=Portunus trituberculatus TaxID=210409 RepID=A0A5B7GR00_PORTR|nr:hypothetical protein [Portunus trituberculatus]